MLRLTCDEMELQLYRNVHSRLKTVSLAAYHSQRYTGLFPAACIRTVHARKHLPRQHHLCLECEQCLMHYVCQKNVLGAASLMSDCCICTVVLFIFLHAYAVRSAKEVPQAEAKGKPATEAPMTPSAWKGTQVCKLNLFVTNICEFALNTLLA